MGDYLEKLIQENRAQFDMDGPSDNVWEGINGGLESRRPKWVQTVWKVAAMLFLATTVALMADRLAEDTPQLSEEMMDFEQVEAYYVDMIEEKRLLLSNYEAQGLEESFDNDLRQLDKLYLELREQFEYDVRDPKVKDAMIINLKIRLDILSRQIEILEKINDNEYEAETTDII